MDFIDKLIKKLEEAKEELNKNVNMSYSSPMNMSKKPDIKPVEMPDRKPDEIKPDKGYGKITIKDTDPKPLKIPTTKKAEEMEKDSRDPKLAPKEVKVKQLQAQIDAGTYKPDPKKIAGAMLKEELYCSENGQWNIKVDGKTPLMAEPKKSK